MSEKVKISLADKDDLEKCMKFYFGNKTIVFNAFACPGNSELTEYFFADRLRKKFSLLEIAELVNGNYEIEEAPEEKILAEYNRLKDLLEKTNDELMKESCKSSMFSIEFTLNYLKVYVKGINY